jgi:DNA (cytosine-5)-methyltransferase 1
MSTFLSIKAAAKKLNLSEQYARKLCTQGKIAAQKVGSSWIILENEIDKYLENCNKRNITNHSSKKSKGSKPIALSFFSGAMGLDIGIEKAGFDILLACEWDKYCRQTIEKNLPEIALLSDINVYSASDIRKAAGLRAKDDIDLIMGGPPCQAFSTAGKRKGFNDLRGNVFLKYIELALELNPKFIVIENVRGLLSCPMEHRPHKHRGTEYPDLREDELKGGALNFIINLLEKSGYGYSFNLYNSANFGTPQIRERVILICSRDGKNPPFLQPTHSAYRSSGLKKWKTVRGSIGRIKKHHHINFPEKRLKYYRLLKAGQNWRDLPLELQKEALGKSFYAGGGKTGFLRRLAWDKPSPTLVTHPAMPATDLAHPEQDRPLSIEEYKKIQEFPQSWKLEGPLLEQYKQIGNAVPVSLGYAVGKLIKNLIEGKKVPNIEGFEYSRYKNTSDREWKIEFEKNRLRRFSSQINLIS